MSKTSHLRGELTRMGRDQLMKFATLYFDHLDTVALSRVEQNKPGVEQTIPTCLFCDLIIADGKEGIASHTGAVICADCIASANGILAGRPDLTIRLAVPDEDEPEVEACLEACADYPRCPCGDQPCDKFPGCGCVSLRACRKR